MISNEKHGCISAVVGSSHFAICKTDVIYLVAPRIWHLVHLEFREVAARGLQVQLNGAAVARLEAHGTEHRLDATDNCCLRRPCAVLREYDMGLLTGRRKYANLRLRCGQPAQWRRALRVFQVSAYRQQSRRG